MEGTYHRVKNSKGENAFIPPPPPPKRESVNTDGAESEIQNLNRRLIEYEYSLSDLRFEVLLIRHSLKRGSEKFAFVFAMLIASIVTLATVLSFVVFFK